MNQRAFMYYCTIFQIKALEPHRERESKKKQETRVEP